MPDGLHDHDALAWSERQAELLRRVADGELPNEAVDWPNVIEEVLDLGRSELHACEGLLQQALVHLLKLHLWPESPAAPHWRGEAAGFLASAQRRFAPSMRQRIDTADLYGIAAYAVRAGADEAGQALDIVPACPLSLDDLLSGRPDIRTLANRLGQRSLTGS